MSTLQVFGAVVLVLFLGYGIARVRRVNVRAICSATAIVFVAYLACTAAVIAGALSGVRLTIPAQLACVIGTFFFFAIMSEGTLAAVAQFIRGPVAVPVQLRGASNQHAPRRMHNEIALLLVFGSSAMLHAYVVLGDRFLG